MGEKRSTRRPILALQKVWPSPWLVGTVLPMEKFCSTGGAGGAGAPGPPGEPAAPGQRAVLGQPAALAELMAKPVNTDVLGELEAKP